MIFHQTYQQMQLKHEFDWTDSVLELEHSASNNPLHLPELDNAVHQ